MDAIAASDFDALTLLLNPDVVVFDHRAGPAAVTVTGRDAFLASTRAHSELGFVRFDAEPLAARGGRLVLSHLVMMTDHGFELSYVDVLEIDDQGRQVRHDLYDDRDLHAAATELDVRYLAGEGAADATVLSPAFAFGDATRRGRWDAVLALTAPDFELIDHRGLWPVLDRNDIVTRFRAGYDEVPDLTWLNRIVMVKGRVLLLVTDMRGTDINAARYSFMHYTVVTVSGDGLLEREEIFEDDDYAAALARLDELGARPD
jgi:ketosteroid isomerase-like protein